jgi:hypothetical protein
MQAVPAFSHVNGGFRQISGNMRTIHLRAFALDRWRKESLEGRRNKAGVDLILRAAAFPVLGSADWKRPKSVANIRCLEKSKAL